MQKKQENKAKLDFLLKTYWAKIKDERFGPFGTKELTEEIDDLEQEIKKLKGECRNKSKAK